MGFKEPWILPGFLDWGSQGVGQAVDCPGHEVGGPVEGEAEGALDLSKAKVVIAPDALAIAIRRLVLHMKQWAPVISDDIFLTQIFCKIAWNLMKCEGFWLLDNGQTFKSFKNTAP